MKIVLRMKKDDANTMVIVGGTLYFIGRTGLFSNWKTHQIIDAASAATFYLGLIGIALILAFEIAWIVHLPAM